MKRLILALIGITLINIGMAQEIDSNYVKAKDSTVTVIVPAKAVIHFSSTLANLPGAEVWKERTAPTYLRTRVPNANTPLDSLVSITVRGSLLADWANTVQAERIGEGLAFYRSVFFNTPSIPGYTALGTQLTTIRNGGGSQRNVAGYVLAKYQNYGTALDNNWNAKMDLGRKVIFDY